MVYIQMAFIGLLSAFSSSAMALPPAEPEIAICRMAQNETAGQTRYQLTVDWNGYADRPYRIDLAMTDESGGTYPQFHDQRLSSGSTPGRRTFTVSTSSLYPLEAVLVTLTQDAARDFDRACAQDGFCSLNVEAVGVELLGDSTVLLGPLQTPEC